MSAIGIVETTNRTRRSYGWPTSQTRVFVAPRVDNLYAVMSLECHGSCYQIVSLSRNMVAFVTLMCWIVVSDNAILVT